MRRRINLSWSARKNPALGRTFTFFAATLERLDRAAVEFHKSCEPCCRYDASGSDVATSEEWAESPHTRPSANARACEPRVRHEVFLRPRGARTSTERIAVPRP